MGAVLNTYIIICSIAFILELLLLIKVNKRLNKIGIDKKDFKEFIDNYRGNKSIAEISLCYTNKIFEIFIIVFIPVVDICSIIININIFSQKDYNTTMDIIEDKIIKEQFKKLRDYDKSHNSIHDKHNFYDNIYSLIKDNNFEHGEIIKQSLQSLMTYIDKYEEIKTISDEDIKYKKEIFSKLQISIDKFKNMAKELSDLVNKKDTSFDNLDEFNLLLDKITEDIKSNRAIFIKK